MQASVAHNRQKGRATMIIPLLENLRSHIIGVVQVFPSAESINQHFLVLVGYPTKVDSPQPVPEITVKRQYSLMINAHSLRPI